MAIRYKVNTGDTLGGIAKRYGTTTSRISGYRSGNQDLIFPGEELTIDDGMGSSVGATGVVNTNPSAPRTGGQAAVNGQVAPDITYGQNLSGPLGGIKSSIGMSDPERRLMSEYGKSIEGGSKSLQDVRDEISAKLMEHVNAVNAVYQSKGTLLQDENKRAREASRALALSSGLAGSNFASSQDLGIQAKGDKLMANLEAERQLKVMEAYGFYDELEQQRLDKERARIENDREKYFQIRDSIKSTAQNSIKSLGSAGVTWDSFNKADPEAAKQLLEESGMTEAEIRATMVTNAPAGTYLNKDKPQIIGNKALFYKQVRDPRTGTMSIETEAVDIPDDGGKEIEQVSSNSSGIYIIYKDGTYNRIGGSATGTGTGTTKPIVSGAITVTPSLIQEANATLDQSRRQDGYVDSNVYKNLFNDWIKNGGIASDFLKIFNPQDVGVDPKDSSLPENLRPYRTVYYNNDDEFGI